MVESWLSNAENYVINELRWRKSALWLQALMSSSTSNSKPAEPSKNEQPTDTQQSLGVLEEDDEFEEFPVAGRIFTSRLGRWNLILFLDWNDSETDLAHLGGAPGAAKSGGDKLWEDNWDDDDIEDDFSVQLR